MSFNAEQAILPTWWWHQKVFHPALRAQCFMAVSVFVLTPTAGRFLYDIIPHYTRKSKPSGDLVRVSGWTPEEEAPLTMSLNLLGCCAFAVFNLICISVEACVCLERRLVVSEYVAFMILNLIQGAGWIWASGAVGSVMWEWESYMHINLLHEPAWWAAFIFQVVYALAFLIPILVTITFLSSPAGTYTASADEEAHQTSNEVEESEENEGTNMSPGRGSTYGT